MIQYTSNQADSTNSGRKGISYDWQSLLATEGVAAIEAELSDLMLESAE